MDMINILFQAHLQSTQMRPITHNEVNIEKCVLPTTQEEYNESWKKAYEIFQKQKNLIGSVDVNPEVWASICLSTIMESKKNLKPFRKYQMDVVQLMTVQLKNTMKFMQMYYHKIVNAFEM